MQDDFCAEFNIKYTTTFNYEDFIISDNFYLTNQNFLELVEQINNNGEVIFKGFSDNYLKLTTSEVFSGKKNINYNLFSKSYFNETGNIINVSVNTGYIIEPAVIDRILPVLKNFYDAEIDSKISLVNFME